jgi:hypothetical protein
MMFAPQGSALESNLTRPATRPTRSGQTSNKHTSSGGTGTATPNITNHPHPGTRTPKPKAVRLLARPNMVPRQNTAPDTFGGFSFLDGGANNRHSHRQPSFNARALDLASEIGDNKFNTLGNGNNGMGNGGDDFSGMPASFSEAFLRERDFERRREAEQKRSEEEEKGMVNRIMLARMNTLEEGFREVLKEIKTISSTAASAAGVASRHGSEGEIVGIKARAKLERTDSRRSPRKIVRKGGKGKEVAETKERPGSGLREEEGVDDEVRSPVSVVGPGQRFVGGGDGSVGDAQAGDEPVTPPEDAQSERREN